MPDKFETSDDDMVKNSEMQAYGNILTVQGALISLRYLESVDRFSALLVI